MIWNVNRLPPAVDPALTEYVRARVRACDTAETLDDEVLADLAHAVSLFCMPSPDRACIDSRLLDLALARALSGMGHGPCALAVLEASDACANGLSGYLPLVNQPNIPGVVWKVCASRALRVGGWVGDDVDAAWVLDVRRLTDARDAGLELVQFSLVRRLIELLVPVWDEAGGSGVLGLAGLDKLNGRAGRKPADAVATEWLVFARDVLRRQKKARGWLDTPRVVRSDLRVRAGKTRLAR